MLDVIASWEEVYNLATRPPKFPSNSAWFNVSIVCFICPYYDFLVLFEWVNYVIYSFYSL